MSEKENQTPNKYGINRDLYKKTARRASGEGKGEEKRRFVFDTYYKIVGILTLIIAIAYCALHSLGQNGYMLINTTILYWMWFALIICIILLLGRFVANIPQNPLTRKSVKICVAIVSVITIFMTYLSCIQRIDYDLHQCAEIVSDDGAHDIVVFRADMESLTVYKAYPRRNSVFCDSSATDDVIMLIDGADVDLKKEWTDDSLRLFVESGAIEGMESITIPLD